LKEDGYLCLLTSSQWLDVEYGFRLQAWILRNFEIMAVFESIDEPWFVGARVATAVTILRGQSEDKKRNCPDHVKPPDLFEPRKPSLISRGHFYNRYLFFSPSPGKWVQAIGSYLLFQQ